MLSTLSDGTEQGMRMSTCDSEKLAVSYYTDGTCANFLYSNHRRMPDCLPNPSTSTDPMVVNNYLTGVCTATPKK